MAKRKETEVQTRTRVLLVLWGLGGSDIKRSHLNKRIVRSGERAGDYDSLFSELEASGTITITGTKRSPECSLVNPQGLQLLRQGLNHPDFEFKSQVGAKMVNLLLKWIREMGSAPDSTDGATPIDSYETFKDLVLEVYERLNKDYNFDDLVPIYRIRREIGDRTDRSQFNEWLLEMQANDILQLQGGSLPDQDPAKIEDSITTELSGLRCYAKLL